MRILIVEDDLIIAGTLCAIVADAGHSVAGLSMEKDSAIALLQSTDIDFAFIDVRLADGPTGFDVARAAHARGVPFAFATSNLRMVLENFAGSVGTIAKPYDHKTIVSALAFIETALGGRPAGAPPSGLILSSIWIEQLGLSGGEAHAA